MTKKISLLDVFGAKVKPLQPFRLQPRRPSGYVLRTEQFAEGIVHFGSRAAYLEPPPKPRHTKMLNAQGLLVPVVVPIPQPWKRVTPRPVKSGQQRRAWLAEQRRANA